MLDEQFLAHLAQRITKRPRGIVRTPIGKRYGIRRDPVKVAYRYLRRFRKGPWHTGGYHVGRPNFGPALCFPTTTAARDGRTPKPYVDLRAASSKLET